MSLMYLARTYAKLFPLQFQVKQGYYGRNMDLELCTGDPYNAYCTKQTDIAVIQDTQGNSYSVPMGSAFKFSLVPPNNKPCDQGIGSGQVFTNLSDVMSSKSLPRVLAVTRGSSPVGASEKSSVKERELLVVLGVHKPKSSTKRALKVLSVSTNTEKLLTLDCTASFSTQPSLISMYLPDILRLFPDSLPCQAFVFLDEEHPSLSRDQLATNFLLSPVRILAGSTVATSLLVSSAKTGDMGTASLLEIPVDDNLQDVELSLVNSLSSDELRMLKVKTVSVLASFSPSNTSLLADKPSSRIYRTQLMLYSTIRPGAETTGVRFETTILDDVSTLQDPSQEDPDLEDSLHALLAPDEMENLYESLRDYDRGDFPAEGPQGKQLFSRTMIPASRPTAKHQLPLPPTLQSSTRPHSASSVSSKLRRNAKSMDTLVHPSVQGLVHRSSSLRPPDPASFLEAQSRRFETTRRMSSEKALDTPLKLSTTAVSPRQRLPKLEASHAPVANHEDATSSDPAYISPIVSDKSFHISHQQQGFDNQDDPVSSMYSQLKPVDRQTSTLLGAMQQKWEQSIAETQAELNSVKEKLTALQAQVQSIHAAVPGTSSECDRPEAVKELEAKNKRFLSLLSTTEVS